MFLLHKNAPRGCDQMHEETCLLKQTASGAQSVTSPSKIEGFREFEADLSALFFTVSLPAMRVDIYFCNIFLVQMLYC